jgi:N-acetylglucosamine-6-sulfatase
MLLAPALISAGTGWSKAADRPNIVFILMDDLRWDALGCTGHPFVKTPNIDRLAREGAKFSNFFVTTPLCSPSRASFLTGRYVHAHGVTGNRDNNALSHQLVTFPKLLHDAGYSTAYVGKWHMGNDDSPRPGFDRWVSFRGQGVYVDPLLNIDGQAEKKSGYISDLLSDYAVEFVKKPHTKPFALYLAHKAVHGPFTPAERHKDLYAADPIPRRPNVQDNLEGKPALTRPVETKPAAQKGTVSGDELIRNQLRVLTAVDEGIGRILKALEETGRLDSTMVVFTSDNGYFWGEHALGDKRWAYEESLRDPLIVRYPKLIKAGMRIEEDALNVDIASTFLDLAGVQPPRNLHGRSLLPLFQRKAKGWRKSMLFEYFAEVNFPRTPSWQAVRTARWKYIHYTDLQGMDELYDLRADPYEMTNRIGEPGAASALKELQKELPLLLQQTS